MNSGKGKASRSVNPNDLLVKALASEIGVPRELRRAGVSLNDFLRNRIAPSDDAATVGAKILEYFCLDEDRQYNGIRFGVQLAICFLDERLDGPSADARTTAIKDLRKVMDESPPFESILGWVRSYYR